MDGSGKRHLTPVTFIQAIAGGTVSKLTGGKFGNGATTSAIQFLVNEVSKVLKRRVDVMDPKEQEPEVVSVKRKRVYASWIGSAPPGVKFIPDFAWKLVNASVYAEYEVEYITTATKTTQETVTTQWLEDASGNVSNVGQRRTTESLNIEYNTKINIRLLGIVGTTNLPNNAQKVHSSCITLKMKGC